MSTTLVIGATGSIGAHLVAQLNPDLSAPLTAPGAPLRALVRDRGRAEKLLGDRASLVEGDLADLAALTRAFDGVDRLFLSCANRPDQVELECAALDAAAAAGVRRVVKVSALGAELGSPAFFWDAHARIEAHARGLGLPAVVLRPAFLMTNLLASAATVRATRRLFAPAEGAVVAMVDPRDVAAVAAAVLTAEDFDPATVTLTGPESLTFDHVAADLSAATGAPVAFVPVPDDAARQAMVADGLPEFAAQQIVTIFGQLRGGVAASTTGEVQRLTGSPARSLAAFANDHAEWFASDPAVATG